MIVQIEALDTLFFRDGRPFTMGEDTWANGVFPPSPSVFYGALRSALLSLDKTIFPKLVNDTLGSNAEFNNIRILSINLAVDGTAYFPIPLDLVQKKEKTRKEKRKLKAKKVVDVHGLSVIKVDNESYSSTQTQDLLQYGGEGDIEAVSEGYIKREDFVEYLKEEVDDITAKTLEELTLVEPKVGIGKSYSTNTAEEGALYRAGMRRLKNVKFYLNVETAISFKDQKLLKLGGEAKAVRLKQDEYDAIEQNLSFEQKDIVGKSFKVYLASPTLFEQGWLPSWINPKTNKGTYTNKDGKSLSLELVAAAVGKPLLIGGFDVKIGEPKTMYRAVPAGSVYYFKVISDKDVNISVFFDRQSFNDELFGVDYKKQGFGKYYLGAYKHS